MPDADAPSTAGDAPRSRVGEQVSHYKILGEIGSGGMGIVYHAVDLNLGRDVAMKCAWPDRTADPFLRKRMLREARAAARILHPSIVPVLEAFEEAGVLWLVMERVEGKSLRDLLRGGTRMTPLALVHCGEEIADALSAAHKKGILHRDVTPGNVLLAADGRSRLTDFGLATFMPPADNASEASTLSSSITGEGRILGTLPYMSPEQSLGKPLDARSDIFSAGAVLYAACAGEPPFPGATAGSIMDGILHREPIALARVNYELPEELERIIRKALAKRPDERYQTAAEMAADLRALRRRLDSQDLMSTMDVAAGSRRSWTPWVLLGLSLALLTGVGGWTWIHRAPEAVLPTGTPTQLTSGPGFEAEPALSPDGEFVAFTSDESGKSGVWLMDLRGKSSLQLSRDAEVDGSPSWFPDGSALAFVSVRSGNTGVWKMPRFPGAAVLLLPDAMDPAVSPDGTRIAFVRNDSSGGLRIQVAPFADLAHPKTLTTEADGLWDHHHPAWSPDGKSICYEAFRDLWLVDPDGGPARPLTSDHQSDREPVWSADGRFVYFSSDRGGARALWRVPVPAGKPVRLTLGAGPESQPSIDRTGSRLAYSTYAGGATMVLADRKTGQRTPWPGPRMGGFPTLDPSGRSLYYTAEHGGRVAIWVQAIDGGRPKGDPRPLCEQPGVAGSLAVSPDSNWVVYYAITGERRDLWKVPASGGVPSRLTDGPGRAIHPAVSPDGTTIGFVSDRDGSLRVWTMPLGGGTPTRVTSGPGTDLFPEWSRDGKTLAFTRNRDDTSDAWTTPLDGRGPAVRWTERADARRVLWDGESGGLLVSGTWGGDRLELRLVASPGATPRPLSHPIAFGDAQAMGDFSLTRDGRSLAFIEESRRGDLWLLEARAGTF